MLSRPLLAFGFLAIGTASAVAQAPGLGCESSDERTAYYLSGEISGSHDYVEELPTGWVFWMRAAPFGWDLRIYSNLPGNRPGVDMASITPPFNGPNPREIYGWHFRNTDNTGANLGDVNAPQELRLFSFSPALIGTGGFRPPDGVLPVGPDPNDGRGWLRIIDYGLADLAPGELARMVYLRFEACLTWPAEFDPLPPEPIGFELEDIERIRGCGLDESLEPTPFLQPPLFEVDFDFDGAWDIAMPVEQASDGKRAIAICRAGTWLHVIGLDGDLGQLQPAYFDRMDWWVAEPNGPILQGVGEGPPPIPAGDTLTIGIEGASSVKLYWDGTNFQAYWQGD
ncbi:MAG: hypothetical protein ACTSWI_01895 [Alphaproteobacteria bacterium]